MRRRFCQAEEKRRPYRRAASFRVVRALPTLRITFDDVRRGRTTPVGRAPSGRRGRGISLRKGPIANSIEKLASKARFRRARICAAMKLCGVADDAAHGSRSIAFFRGFESCACSATIQHGVDFERSDVSHRQSDNKSLMLCCPIPYQGRQVLTQAPSRRRVTHRRNASMGRGCALLHERPGPCASSTVSSCEAVKPSSARPRMPGHADAALGGARACSEHWVIMVPKSPTPWAAGERGLRSLFF